MAVEFRVLDSKQADDLFTAPRDAEKWAEIIRQLLLGHSVFVPSLTRVGRESLRSIITHRKYGTLRSRTTIQNDQEGMVLRLDRVRQPGAAAK